MIRRTLVAAVLLALASCSTSPTSTPATALEACLVFDRTLSTLAVARYQGRLTPAQIASVDDAVQIVDPICDAAEPPPASATSTLDSINRTLETIIFTSGVQQ